MDHTPCQVTLMGGSELCNYIVLLPAVAYTAKLNIHMIPVSRFVISILTMDTGQW
uniref:Uncharacterized protein n=1 Tax=Octopus bimaculoides TaxID=37653 RepID=A0A0L8HR62_OCTBM